MSKITKTDAKVIAFEPSHGKNALTTYHRETAQQLTEDADSMDKRAIGELYKLAALVSTDEVKQASPFVGIDVHYRVRTWTYRNNASLAVSPEELAQLEGAEWVSVRANTTFEHLKEKYGDRLIFYVSERKEQKVSILMWDVYDAEKRSGRVLVRTAK